MSLPGFDDGAFCRALRSWTGGARERFLSANFDVEVEVVVSRLLGIEGGRDGCSASTVDGSGLLKETNQTTKSCRDP